LNLSVLGIAAESKIGGNEQMWVSKTPEECKTDKQRSHRKQKRTTLLVVLGIVVMMTCFRGGFKSAKGFDVVPFDEMLVRFVGILVPAIFFLFLFWITEARLAKSDDEESEPTLVCPKCEQVKAWDGYLPCECGGRFVDIKTMKWVEEKAS
jgi:hypothetical protein